MKISVTIVLAILVLLSAMSCKNEIDTMQESSLKINKNQQAQLIDLGLVNIEDLKIGDTLNIAKTLKTAPLILSNSSEMDHHFKTIVNEVVFDLGVDENKVLKFISTIDQNFRSKEGLTINKTLREVYQKLKKDILQVEQGWGKYIALKNDWNASFTIEDFDNVNLKNLDSKLNFFFKR